MPQKPHAISKEGLVIFAGAGCSMAPPSSLPGWYDLNDAILDTLWDRLEAYRITKGFREKVLPSIKKRRNDNKFPPDYQAQLMAERVGIKYFELLGTVDAQTYNPVQYYTAQLAKAGMIKAVVTTNFDQNFERAFNTVGVDFQAFYDEKGFKSMKENGGGSIPIIKIHGTCAVPGSMIDTRKQRLKGRSAALKKALQQLLHKYHFLFAGFSGEDFDDNANYLGFRDAAPNSKGFTYLCFPGAKVRQSMQNLISLYGADKAASIEVDPALYLEEMANNSAEGFKPFQINEDKPIPIKEKLAGIIAALEPMDAINMLTALTESYGDEVSARFLYDRTWKSRNKKDYDGEGFQRFLLNYGRSFVFNFQDRLERATSAGVVIANTASSQMPEGAENYFINPAQQNLHHVQNTSPETVGLIALTQTYMGNPSLFKGFPDSFFERFQSKPSISDSAEIYYYYSYYAMIYGEFEKSMTYLNSAIKHMEEDFDEPRLSRLLSRRALIKFRINHDEAIRSGKEDANRAKELAKKYHEPVQLALADLALATCARVNNDFHQSYELIHQSVARFSNLFRIPQVVECEVELLKIILLGFGEETVDKGMLLASVQDIINRMNGYITERIHVFEPEYCYLIGMIFIQYTDASKAQYLPWFADALSFARLYKQERNFIFFKETCAQLNILGEVEQMIRHAKA